MDKKLEMEILSAVRSAIAKVQSEQTEVWLSAKELCQQFQFLTPSWLKSYGKLLPQTAASVTGPDGTVTTHTAYARNEIQAMIRDGRIHELTTEKCVYRAARSRVARH